MVRTARLIEGLTPYDPKSLPADIRLSANENPLDVPASVKQAMLQRIADTAFNRYPDPCANGLRGLIARNIAALTLPTVDRGSRQFTQMPELETRNIVVGNGGDELLFNAFLAFGGPDGCAITTPPTFSVYDIDAQLTSTPVASVPRLHNFDLDEEALLARIAQGGVSMVIITSPNNPTGNRTGAATVRRVLEATDALVLVDEVYGEFSGHSCLPLLDEFDNLCVLRTFSKAYALAGVRLGYVVAAPSVIEAFLAVRQPYSVDAVSQVIGEQVCLSIDAFAPVIRGIIERRQILFEKLSRINGVRVFPSSSNFLMLQVPDAAGIWSTLAQNERILVRDQSSQPGLDNMLRITVGTAEENDALLVALANSIMKGYSHA